MKLLQAGAPAIFRSHGVLLAPLMRSVEPQTVRTTRSHFVSGILCVAVTRWPAA